jgi:dTMP kinase
LINLLEPLPKPDLTFVFDVSLATALGRIAKVGKQDRIELEHESFFARVKAGYLDIAASNPKQIKVINAEVDINQTQKVIKGYLDQLLAGLLVEHQ